MLFHKFVIIGAGKTGLDVCQRLASQGLDVLLVEANDIGGSYLFSYDYPKEILSSEAKQYVQVNQTYPNLNLDKDQTVDFLSKRVKKRVSYRYRKLKNILSKYENLEIIYGRAKFNTKNILSIAQKDGQEVNVAFEHCLICAGKSEMTLPNYKGIENVNLLHQHNSFFGEVIPESLAILGVSKQNLEIAEIFTNLGTAVTIFDSGAPEQILPNQDTTGINYILQNLLRKGIEFYFNLGIRKISNVQSEPSQITDDKEVPEDPLSQTPTETTARIQIEDDEENNYTFSHLYAEAIESYNESLGLELVGVKFSDKGIYCTSTGQTTQKNIWTFGSASNSFRKVSMDQQLHNFVEKYKSNNALEANLSRSLVMLNPVNNQNATEIIDFSFDYEYINLNRPVVTVGLPYKKAVGKYGPIIRFNIIFNDDKEGFVKVIYNEHNKQILGFVGTGEVCDELYTVFVSSLIKTTTIKDFENLIFNLGYKR